MKLIKPIRLWIVALVAILIINGQVRLVAAHGDEESFARATDLLTTILALMLTSITSFIIWAPGKAKLGLLQYGIISLGTMTAVIHLFEGLARSPWLILNGLGYVGLLGILYWPLGILVEMRHHTRRVFIGYTLLTIVLFFVAHPWGKYNGMVEWLGIGTKAVELALIGLLLLEFKQAELSKCLSKE